LRSPERLALLVGKEWRELRAARAWWLFLLAAGALVGHAFVTAVATYAEVSGAGGGPAALSQGVSPLDGFIVPVFGAYAIAATLLLPFVAIRLMATDKESGSASLTLASGVRAGELVLAKFLVALAGWLVAVVPGLVALVLWRVAGGHLNGAEAGVVLFGHLLRAAFTIALALAAAAITESASTAAIVALGVTLGTWALDFVGAVQGGAAQRLARLTPDAALRVFERGELSVAVVMSSLVVIVAFLAIAALALRMSRTPRRSGLLMALVLLGAVVAAGAAGRARGSADLSEDRRNSFSPADERALAAIREPLDVEVHLSPEDPRLADLERGVLHQLERSMHDVRVRYVSASATGLFDKPDPSYGEVWYTIGRRREMSRSTTVPIVLESIYRVAGTQPPAAGIDAPYPGYPLVMRAGARWIIFFVVWPLLVLLGWRASRRPSAPSLSDL
jgi:hypothetical protein